MALLKSFILSLSIASCGAFLLQNHCRNRYHSSSSNVNLLHSYLALKLQLDENETASASPSKMRSLKFVQLSYQTEPGLLADYLMELGAASVSVTDHDKGTDLESPIFAEPMTYTPNTDNDEFPAIICGDAAVGKNGKDQDDVFDSWGDLKNLWMRCDVSAHFPESFDLMSIVDQVRCSFDLGTTPRFEVDDVPDLDWVQHVQSSWKPFVVGDFILKFPWHTEKDVQEAIENRSDEDTRNLSDYQELLLEGGIAFGTGEHPTTQLCLEWITKLLRENDAVEKFLDYGAGSGVLGIAACKLKPFNLEATGVEIDADAIRIADANAVNNKVTMKNYLPVYFGDDDASASVIMKAKQRSVASTLPSNLDGPIFDACAANILAGPLISLSKTIAEMLKPGGKLGLSGILTWQGEDVVKAYSEYFDDVKVENERNGWCLVTGVRKQLFENSCK